MKLFVNTLFISSLTFFLVININLTARDAAGNYTAAIKTANVSASGSHATYYVDGTNGNDSNNGTSLSSAFKTFEKGLESLHESDTLYIREGTYILGNNRPNFTSNQAGTSAAYTQILAYNNEQVIIDAHNVSNSGGLNNNALRIRAGGCYLKIAGIDFTEAKGYGVCLTDNAHDIEFDNCKFYDNGDCGVYGTTDLRNISIINCDAYKNYDPNYHGSNADGFGFKYVAETGSITFKDCRAWQNSDDGWDFYKSKATFTLENCWAYNHGENLWDDTAFKGDGNGFKFGAGTPEVTVNNCLAWNNGVTRHYGDGFDMNGNVGDVAMISCISYNNERNNYNFYTPAGEVSTTIFYHIKNSINYITNHDNYQCVEVTNCSWYPANINIQASDWISLDDASAKGARATDGALPDRQGFLVPATGTKIESILNGGNTGSEIKNANDYNLSVCPNPTNGTVNVELNSTVNGAIIIRIMNLSGSTINVFNEQKNSGIFNKQLDVSSLKGIYIISVSDEKKTIAQKLIVR